MEPSALRVPNQMVGSYVEGFSSFLCREVIAPRVFTV